MKKPQSLLLVLFAATFGCTPEADKSSTESNSPLNILLINADDLGMMDLGYNTPAFRTPNIDRLLSQGRTFGHAYKPAANFAPSRAAMHSGQWGARHGVYTVGHSERGESAHRRIIPTKNTPLLPPGTYTMAKAFRDNGYRTIHLGKCHIGNDPLQDGFEINVGGDARGGPYGDGYYSPWGRGLMTEWSDTVPPDTHRVDVYLRETIRFMEAHKNEPMFIHFSPYLVRTPITPDKGGRSTPGCERFLSFDICQVKLAKAAGVKVPRL